MALGNQRADALARNTLSPHRPRNFAAHPPTHTDDYYITTQIDGENRPLDGSPLAFVKTHTTAKLENKHKSGKGSRNGVLAMALDPTVHSRLSNIGAYQKLAKHLETHILLFKTRQHAITTNAKMCKYARYPQLPPEKQRYYAEMYPNNLCTDCDIAGAQAIDNTTHALTCPHIPNADTDADTLWRGIYDKIDSRKAGRGGKSSHLLKPFAYPGPEATASHSNAIQQHRIKRNSPLQTIIDFNQSAARYGYIPAALPSALRELGVKGDEADRLAEEIALAIHEHIRARLNGRCRRRADRHDQRGIYRRHVLGKPPPGAE